MDDLFIFIFDESDCVVACAIVPYLAQSLGKTSSLRQFGLNYYNIKGCPFSGFLNMQHAIMS